MSDAPLFGADDHVEDVEALLRDLDASDMDITTPPADVWTGIEAAIAADQPAAVVPLRRSRSTFRTRFLAAAAAFAAVAGGAALVASLVGTDDEPVVATAELAYDPETFDEAGAESSATAELIERDGRFEIRLDEASLPNPDGEDLELWLIAVGDDGALDVQPVALVDPTSPGTYEVPADLDPSVHSIVDISVEPRDGVETHSGRSILRGPLLDV